MCFSLGLPFGKFTQGGKNAKVSSCGRSDRRVCRARFCAKSGPYYVGFDTSAHTCSVVTEMKPGMKNMGQFETKDEADKAMAGMKECKGAM